MIGRLTTLPKVKSMLEPLESLYDVRFHVPASAEFMTARGAAMT